MIDRQLCKRLWETGIISAYRIEIEHPSKQLIREGKLNSILGENKTCIGVINVNIKMQKAGELMSYRHNIVI